MQRDPQRTRTRSVPYLRPVGTHYLPRRAAPLVAESVSCHRVTLRCLVRMPVGCGDARVGGERRGEK